MKKSSLLLTTFLLVLAAATASTPADTLLLELKRHTKEDTVKLRLLNQLVLQFHAQNTKQSVAFATQAVQLSRKLGNKAWIAKALAFSGMAHIYATQRPTAIKHLLEALDIVRKLGPAADPHDHFFILNNLALINYDQDQNASLNYLRQALNLTISTKNYYDASTVCNNIGLIFNDKYTQADSAVFYLRKSIFYLGLGKPNPYDLAVSKLNLVELFVKNGQLKAAQDYLLESKSMIVNSPNLIHRTLWFLSATRLYKAKKDYLSALQTCKKAIAIARSYDQGQLPDCLLAYADLWAALQRYDSAYHYTLDASRLIIKINANDKTAIISKIETAYKVKEQKQQNLLLQEQAIRYRSERYLFLFSLLSFSFILLGAFFVNLRLRQQKNQIEHQKIELATYAEKQTQAITSIQQLLEEKRQMISILAHDLRTPLQAIQIKANILGLRSENLNVANEIQRAAQRIHQTTLRIVEVENEQQIAAQKSLKSVSLAPYLHQLVAHFSAITAAKQIRIDLQLANPQIEVIASPQLIEHIFDNLLSNAIKFSPQFGEVTIKAYQNSRWVCIEFIDQGKGMPLETQKDLFKPKIPNLNAQESGLGIGLNICKQYVEIMGGELLFASSAQGTNAKLFLTAVSNAQSSPHEQEVLVTQQRET